MASMPRKNIIHVQYCTNCQSHNWNTHHNQAKYHQTYIKLKNFIEQVFKQNAPIILCNKVPSYLLPIKQQQNKYYNPISKKYMFFPNIGSFQIILNDQIIFSKKKTNNWPVFQNVLNDIAIKINQKPLFLKSQQQKKLETYQSETDFSCDIKNINKSGHKTIYKDQNKNDNKKFGNFTLTDHFKTFHNQNSKIYQKRSQPTNAFDSSSTIKPFHQINSVKHQMQINVEDIQGLKQALRVSKKGFYPSKNNIQNNDQKPSSINNRNQKQILINLCSIQQQSGGNTLDITNMHNINKKPSAFINSQILQSLHANNNIYNYNNVSQKSLSRKKFEQFNNDLKKIQKKFKHIEKKINNRDEMDLNIHQESSRVNEERDSFNQKEQRHRQREEARLSRFKNLQSIAAAQKKPQYYQHSNLLNQLQMNLNNLQNSQIKPINRYDQRYLSPSYYQQNQLKINNKSKKLSQIQKYLKSDNKYKNNKLKRIYGDWKVNINNLHYLHHMMNGAGDDKRMFQDQTNKTRQANRKNNRVGNNNKNSRNLKSRSNNTSSYCSSEDSSIDNQHRRNDKQNLINITGEKNKQQDEKTQKHPSFIIKHKSSYNSRFKKPQQGTNIVSKGKYQLFQQQKISRQQQNRNVVQKNKQNGKSYHFSRSKNNDSVEINQLQNLSQQTRIQPSYSLLKKSNPTSQHKQQNQLIKTLKRQKGQKQTPSSSAAVQHTKNILKKVYNSHSNNDIRKRYHKRSNLDNTLEQKQNNQNISIQTQISNADQRYKKQTSTGIKNVNNKNKAKMYKDEMFQQQLSNVNSQNQSLEKQSSRLNRNKQNNNVIKKNIDELVKVEFHQFELSCKSPKKQVIGLENQIQGDNIQKKQQDGSKQQNSEKQNKQSQIINNQTQQEKNNDISKPKNLIISNQYIINLNLSQQNKSQIMRTKLPTSQFQQNTQILQQNSSCLRKTDNLQNSISNQQNHSNQNQNNQGIVPHLNLNEDHIEQNQDRKSKNKSNHHSRIKSSQEATNHNGEQNNQTQQHRHHSYNHSRRSSYYQQPTYCNSLYHQKASLQPCNKCTHRNQQQIQTNRQRIQSERKQKQLMKEKRFQQNKLRRQILEKQKQEFLFKIEEEKQAKRLQRERESSLRKAEKASMEKLRQKQKEQRRLNKLKLNQQISRSKSLNKSRIHSQINKSKSMSKRINEKHQNKNKRIDETNSISKRKDDKSKSLSKRVNATNLSKKQNSKSIKINSNTLPIQNHNKSISKAVSSIKSEKKNKSISSISHKKKQVENKNAKNKSYFKVQKEQKVQSTHRSNKTKTAVVNNSFIEQQQQPFQMKYNSIAIQTGDLKSERNQQIIQKNRNSQRNPNKRQSRVNKSVKLQSSRIRQKLIQDAYIKKNSRVNKEKNQTKKNNKKVTKNSRKKTNQSADQQSFINEFQSQMYREVLIPSKYFQRQQAMILKQIYNMKKEINNQQESYQKLYQNDKLYRIVNRNDSQQAQQTLFQLISDAKILQLSQQMKISSSNNSKVKFISIENLLRNQNVKHHTPQISLFNQNSIQIHKIKSNQPQQTRNLHKVLCILAQKNQLLIVRLFQDYKSKTSINIQSSSPLSQKNSLNVYLNQFSQQESDKLSIQKSYYGVWLCINQQWKLTVVNNIVPVTSQFDEQHNSTSTKPLFSYHSNNQLWPTILQKSIAVALGGYQKLFSLSVGQIFSLLTGSNYLSYTISQNISKNKTFLKQIAQNEKKNFVMICQRHSLNLKEQNQKLYGQATKVYYLLSSKKVINNNNNQDQKEEIIFKLRQSTISSTETQSKQQFSSIQRSQPFYIKYQKFCQTFKLCQVLHLRQHYNFTSIQLNQSNISIPLSLNQQQHKEQTKNHFYVVQLTFNESSFGTITVCNQQKSQIIRTYLYKLENSDHQIMKLVGEASKTNKKQLFFDCYFQQNKYYLFIQSSIPNCVLSYMGQGRPEIKIKQQILSNTLRNQSIQYLPISNYEGNQQKNLNNVMNKTKSSSNWFSNSKYEESKKPNTMQNLRQMFVQLMIEERRMK